MACSNTLKTSISNASHHLKAPLNTPQHHRLSVRARATEQPATRRATLELLSSSALVSAAAVFSRPKAALADEEEEFQTYLGLASPPTSYGGYGGNAEETPKYSFEYPAGWKVAAVNKVQKGTQGIDCIINNPRNKEMRAFVIALGRAGEDDKSFRLTDVDSTFAGFAGADYDLQDALVSSTDSKKSERDVDGRKFFDYDISSPSVRYLSTVTVKDGKVFAFFIKSPAKAFGRMEDKFRAMVASFKTL